MNSKLEYRVSVSCDSNVAGQNGWGHAGRLSRPPSHPSDTYVLFMLCGESRRLTCLCFCVSSSQGVFHCLTETANLGPKAFYKVSPSRRDVLCIVFFFFIFVALFLTLWFVSPGSRSGGDPSHPSHRPHLHVPRTAQAAFRGGGRLLRGGEGKRFLFNFSGFSTLDGFDH